MIQGVMRRPLHPSTQLAFLAFVGFNPRLGAGLVLYPPHKHITEKQQFIHHTSRIILLSSLRVACNINLHAGPAV